MGDQQNVLLVIGVLSIMIDNNNNRNRKKRYFLQIYSINQFTVCSELLICILDLKRPPSKMSVLKGFKMIYIKLNVYQVNVNVNVRHF